MGKDNKSRRVSGNIGKKLLYLGYLIIITFLGLEIALRIFNPFHLRLRGDHILLPVGQTTTIVNRINPKLDSLITNTRNALGLRGPELPTGADRYLTIITVGGSTTECRFLSDDRTWPFLTGKMLEKNFHPLWLNNAGLDGHSTFGHQVLLNDYLLKLRPRVITFLVGINDVENDQPTFHDKLSTRGAYSDFRHFIFENSEVLNLLLNLSRGWKAQRLNNTTQKMMVMDSLQQLRLSPGDVDKRIRSQQAFLPNYRRRIDQLIDSCTNHGILPVLITQPNLFGVGRDSATGTNLELFPLEKDLNGGLLWQMLEIYNGVTRQEARSRSVPLIDLARLMPKNSLYFYDGSHFTNAGAEKVASIVSRELEPVLAARFPGFLIATGPAVQP